MHSQDGQPPTSSFTPPPPPGAGKRRAAPIEARGSGDTSSEDDDRCYKRPCPLPQQQGEGEGGQSSMMTDDEPRRAQPEKGVQSSESTAAEMPAKEDIADWTDQHIRTYSKARAETFFNIL